MLNTNLSHHNFCAATAHSSGTRILPGLCESLQISYGNHLVIFYCYFSDNEVMDFRRKITKLEMEFAEKTAAYNEEVRMP